MAFLLRSCATWVENNLTWNHLQMPDDELDKDFDFTRMQRLKILNEMTDNGSKKLENNEDRHLALQVLNDMDRTAIGRKRIKTDEKATTSNVLMAKAIIESLLDQKNLHAIGRVDVIEGVGTVVEPSLPDYTPKHGEMDVGHPTETYVEFMARMNDGAQS
jgi:hypothetical protein